MKASSFQLDHSIRIPRYLQVKDALKAEIEKGELSGKLPSEKDLGQHFGVSYMTARRAVSELVAEGLISRELGRGTFVIDAPSPSLSGTILFVLSSLNSNGVRNPYFLHIFNALEEAAHHHGFATLFSTRLTQFLPNPSLINSHSNTRISGIVATAIEEKETLLRISQHIPVVLLNNWKEKIALPTVSINQAQGAKIAVKHLIKLGHKRIAHISSGLDVHSGVERTQGYQQALKSFDLPFHSNLIIEADFSFQGGYESMTSLLTRKNRPTAVFCSNDLMALGAMKCLHDRKVKVPKEMSIVGFGDIDQASQVSPSLTTVHVPKKEVGYQAFALLQQIMAPSSKIKSNFLSTVNTSLIVRDSCSIPNPCHG